MSPAKTSWRSRIIGHGQESPESLVANPKNWKSHPSHQQRFLGGVLDQVGWVQEITVNQRSGLIVDGHLRVALALTRGEDKVPVRYVDLNEEEEALVLASLDPLASMATTDQGKLDDLLLETVASNEAVEALLELLTSKEDDIPSGRESTEHEQPEWGVSVICGTEQEQNELLEQFRSEGRICRVLA